MTKRIWKLHSWMGLIAGLGLLVIGITGSPLVFAKELKTLFHPQIMRVEEVRAQRLPFDTLLTEANRALRDYRSEPLISEAVRSCTRSREPVRQVRPGVAKAKSEAGRILTTRE